MLSGEQTTRRETKEMETGLVPNQPAQAIVNSRPHPDPICWPAFFQLELKITYGGIPYATVLTAIIIFFSNEFWPKFWFLTADIDFWHKFRFFFRKISTFMDILIFSKNLDFHENFRFFRAFRIFGKIFDFFEHFEFLVKFSISEKNFNFW